MCVGEGGKAESGEKVAAWEKVGVVQDGNIKVRIFNFKCWALFLYLKWVFYPKM